MQKKFDKTAINLITILISGTGLFAALTKLSVPEANLTFWRENPFAIKRDIIETTMTWIFTLLALSGLVIQTLKEIFGEKIPDRLHRIRFYCYSFFIGIFVMVGVVVCLAKVGHKIAKKRWQPVIIENQKNLLLSSAPA